MLILLVSVSKWSTQNKIDDSLFLVFAACAVIATSLAQIFTSTFQKSLSCNAMQLLYHTAPLIAVVRIPSITRPCANNV
jgi:hypothetical protein